MGVRDVGGGMHIFAIAEEREGGGGGAEERGVEFEG